VLTHLFNYPGAYTDYDLVENMRKVDQEGGMPGICMLWERLSASDLALRLAGGPAMLPDLYEALPRPWAELYRLFRPRTLEQHVELVVRHLEWFLQPQNVPRPFDHFPPALAASAFFMIVMVVLYIFLAAMTSALTGVSLLALMLGVGAVTGAVLGLLWPSIVYRTILKRDPRDLARNATVLYHHLRRAYADAEEPKPGL